MHAASLVLCTSAEACTWPVGDVPNQLRVCVNWQTTVASVSLLRSRWCCTGLVTTLLNFCWFRLARTRDEFVAKPSGCAAASVQLMAARLASAAVCLLHYCTESERKQIVVLGRGEHCNAEEVASLS